MAKRVFEIGSPFRHAAFASDACEAWSCSKTATSDSSVV